MEKFRRYSHYNLYDLYVNTPAKSPTIKPKNFSDTISNMSSDEKIALVFGGRLNGEDRIMRSRITRKEPKRIAGVLVPAKPEEPDNCCMSGCINCVWEIYNQDVQDWNLKRNKAAEMLSKTGGRWPESFAAPVKKLRSENLPLSIANSSAQEAKSTLSEYQITQGVDEEAWSLVPIGIKVFADVDSKIKARHKKRLENIKQHAPP